MKLQVRVHNPEYTRRERYSYAVPQYLVYEGEVYPRPSWIDDTKFCLTTGNADFPFRVIERDKIVDGWRLSSKRSATDNKKVYKVPGNKSSIHLVTNDNGRWSCNCMGFTYRQRCSHVEAAKISA